MECRHLDGDPSNNQLSNLCWGTSAENAADRIEHGTIGRGSVSPTAKLIEADVIAIRQLYARGMLQKEIAALFGLSESSTSAIINGKQWPHVPAPEAVGRLILIAAGQTRLER